MNIDNAEASSPWGVMAYFQDGFPQPFKPVLLLKCCTNPAALLMRTCWTHPRDFSKSLLGMAASSTWRMRHLGSFPIHMLPHPLCLISSLTFFFRPQCREPFPHGRRPGKSNGNLSDRDDRRQGVRIARCVLQLQAFRMVFIIFILQRGLDCKSLQENKSIFLWRVVVLYCRFQ